MAQAARVEIQLGLSPGSFNEAQDLKCRWSHFIEDCQKFSIYQISRQTKKKEKNKARAAKTLQ